MSLKSLDDANREAAKKCKLGCDDSGRNGIACPDCGKEMVDVNPRLVCTSHPPKLEIGCPACGYRGYRVK